MTVVIRACAALAIAIGVAHASVVRAQATAPPPPTDGPHDANPPPFDDLKPIEPREGEPLPTPTPTPDKTKPPTPTTPSKPGKPRAPTPDVSNGGLGAGPCWGSMAGCVVTGCVPAGGSAIGVGVFVTSISASLAQGSGALGTCLGLVGTGAGIFVGAPSTIVLGPCASGGALVGGLAGAALDDRDLSPIFLGALPGIGVGVASSAAAIWGLAVLSASSGDFQTPALILGTSLLLAAAAGPVTVAGITIGDGVAGSHPRRKPAPEDAPAPSHEDNHGDAADILYTRMAF